MFRINVINCKTYYRCTSKINVATKNGGKFGVDLFSHNEKKKYYYFRLILGPVFEIAHCTTDSYVLFVYTNW